MRRLLTFVAACSFLLAAVPAFAQSQATTAEINGRVTDAQGGVLPGATVTVNSSDTGYTRSVVTNAEGLYTIPLLPPGNYEHGGRADGLCARRAATSCSTSAPRRPSTRSSRWAACRRRSPSPPGRRWSRRRPRSARRRWTSRRSRTCRSTGAASRTSSRRRPPCRWIRAAASCRLPASAASTATSASTARTSTSRFSAASAAASARTTPSPCRRNPSRSSRSSPPATRPSSAARPAGW